MVTKVTKASIIEAGYTEDNKISTISSSIINAPGIKQASTDKWQDISNLISLTTIIGLEARGLYRLEKYISILNEVWIVKANERDIYADLVKRKKIECTSR